MTQLLPLGSASPPTRAAGTIDFVDRLAAHGGRVALLDEHGRSWTYTELADAVDGFAARLGPARRLTMVRMRRTADAVVAYLGTLRAGHAVLAVDDESESTSAIESRHRPDVVVTGSAIDERNTGPVSDLHPDLALLLSTSGSTGSPKLVRLSHRNVEANAAAIADYLSLSPSDRAITTLPLHYCFGLSVLHSHLAVGASIALSSASVVDPCFWETVQRTRPTMLAAVPHTIDLLERMGFPERTPDGLRAVLQAGGRLDPDRVRQYALAGRRAGWELFVMYGQTEATARMAYLPPDLAAERPTTVGVPVDGGSFELEWFEGADPGTGEVVYRGPNVMMGYAETREHLDLGDGHDALHTGDVGRIADDGLLEIVGRRSDFLKVFGLRIDLGRVRRMLADDDITATVDGDDDGIVIALADETARAAAVQATVADRLGLPRSAVAAALVPEPPRLSNGKLDRPGLRTIVRGTDDRLADRGVAGIYRSVLGCATVRGDDSFVSLGGDSLSYVEASIALEGELSHLPTDWHLRSVDDLTRSVGAVRRRRTATVETNVVLRAIAIVLVVGNHAGLFMIPGGAHVLFAGAGFNFARFQVGADTRWRSVLRLVAPCAVWIGGVAALSDDFSLSHALLIHGWTDGSGRWVYWFVEALVQVLAVLALLFSVPAVRRLERRGPFAFPAALLVVCLLPVFGVVPLPELAFASFRPHEIAWLFVLGWAVAQAQRIPQRLVLTAVAFAAVPEYFGDTTRTTVLLAGLVLLIWVPRLPVPRPLGRVVGGVAGASLYVYLTHVPVLALTGQPLLALAGSLATGFVAWRLATPLLARAERSTDRALARCN